VKEALFSKKIDHNTVSCHLCHHGCTIQDGKRGICGVRENRSGVLYSLNYAQPVACNLDPIEKKPLFHFSPGSLSLSLATLGCNFSCGFCQNWQISQKEAFADLSFDDKEVPASAIIEEALRLQAGSISYTYTEPTIFFEYAMDIALLAKKEGLANIFVTNGFMGKEALRTAADFLDAANVDLKSFREDFYRDLCKASLKPVLENIQLMKELGIWVEITTLVIPSYNDSRDELTSIARFIASLDPGIPWHISRYHPSYHFSRPAATDFSTLEEAYHIAKEQGLRYVYVGNIATSDHDSTYCYCCGKKLITRRGFSVEENNIQEGTCPFCSVDIEGRWSRGANEKT